MCDYFTLITQKRFSFRYNVTSVVTVLKITLRYITIDLSSIVQNDRAGNHNGNTIRQNVIVDEHTLYATLR